MDEFEQLFPQKKITDQELDHLFLLLKNQGVTVFDLLNYTKSKNTNKLSKFLGISAKELNFFLKKIKDEFLFNKNDLMIKNEDLNYLNNYNSKFIKTGLKNFDDKLGGGLPIGEITEIFGESGTGKSHFLYHLAIQLQLNTSVSTTIFSNLQKKKCIYISTESYLETKRLNDFVAKYDEKNVLLNNILCYFCRDLEIQNHILYTQLPIILKKNNNVGLVIIDSISHHLRTKNVLLNIDYLKKKLKKQDSILKNIKNYKYDKINQEKSSVKQSYFFKKKYYLFHLNRHLIRLAKKFQIAIVVSNQVSDYLCEKNSNEILKTSNPLKLDFQMSINSGWDIELCFLNQEKFNLMNDENQGNLFSKKLDDASIKEFNNKASFFNENRDFQFKSIYLTNLDIQYIKQDLLKEITQKKIKIKKHFPALGYFWSRIIKTKILLIKTHYPVSKDLNNFSNLKKMKKQNFINSFINDDEFFVNWKIKRFAKIICSSSNPENISQNHMLEFKIGKHCFSEV